MTVDISPERLDAWERGDFPPSLEQLKKLAEAYGTRLSVFFLPEPPLDESGYESTRVWERPSRRAAAE
jgi:transcriptional regulator with XRE-family HTH domain